MGMESRHQCGTRRAAEGTVVELRESQTAFGQSVQIRRLDLAAVTAEVGVAQVIRHDHDDVRPLGRSVPASRPQIARLRTANRMEWRGHP